MVMTGCCATSQEEPPAAVPDSGVSRVSAVDDCRVMWEPASLTSAAVFETPTSVCDPGLMWFRHEAEAHPVRWDTAGLPLLVALTPEVVAAGWKPYFEDAVEDWNEALRAGVFILLTGMDASALEVHMPTPSNVRNKAGYVVPVVMALGEDNANTQFFTRKRDGIMTHAAILLPFFADPRQPIVAATVATHELGHVLGLAHDHHPRSVMYPAVENNLSRMRTITASDICVLTGAYDLGDPCRPDQRLDGTPVIMSTAWTLME